MKEHMITRTVVSTKAVVMVCDTEHGTVSNKEVVLNGTFTCEEALKQVNLDAPLVAVKVVSVVTEEQVYGITFSDFMAHAVPVERPASQQKKK